jgi:ATP-dependent 26S proteasome regulatory subunit
VLTPTAVKAQGYILQKKEASSEIMKRFIRSNITLSRLLNAIDGIASPESYILVMATNNISDAHQTLIYPETVDFKPLFRRASTKQTREMFLMLYAEEPVSNNEMEKGSTLLARVQQNIQSPSNHAF